MKNYVILIDNELIAKFLSFFIFMIIL